MQEFCSLYRLYRTASTTKIGISQFYILLLCKFLNRGKETTSESHRMEINKRRFWRGWTGNAYVHARWLSWASGARHGGPVDHLYRLRRPQVHGARVAPHAHPHTNLASREDGWTVQSFKKCSHTNYTVPLQIKLVSRIKVKWHETSQCCCVQSDA